MRIQYWTLSALIAMLAFGGCSKKIEPAQSGSDADSDTHSSAPAAEATDAIWMTDFEAAKARAVEEDKDLLMDFTGSDWCYWCQRLDGEVFSKPGFINEVSAHFVLVKIDFPRDKSRQSQALQEQNQRLSRVYGIQGYPTIILARADGTPYATTSYHEGGPDAYLEHINELRQQR